MPDGSPPRAAESHRLDRRREGPRADEAGNKKSISTATKYGNAYLLTVDMPKHPRKDLPYRIFKVELEDMENGDRGEGLYYMEKKNYVQ